MFARQYYASGNQERTSRSTIDRARELYWFELGKGKKGTYT